MTLINEKTKNLNSSDLLKIDSLIEGVVLEKKEQALFIDLSPWGIGVVRGNNYLGAKNYINKLQSQEKVTVKILDLDTENGLIEIAIKDLGQEEIWKKIKQKQQNNESFLLKITEANAGGLCGTLEGIKGFLPVSQLSSEHYPKVEGGAKEKILEKLKSFIGQELLVKILDFEIATEKLIFSEKLVEKEKLKKIASQYKIGDIIEANITKIVNFGVFVKLIESNLDGLIHISEIPTIPGKDSFENLKPGQKIKAKIIEINEEKIFLSLKL